MFLKLAFRNIWRNKGRTSITIASIMFAVLFSSFMNAFQKGGWVRMLDNVVNFYYGYAQIHKNGYWEEKSINKAFELTDEFEVIKNGDDNIVEITPRLESFALASYGVQTSGMLIVGTDPQRENTMTDLKAKLVEGEYINAEDKSILIAEGVKDLLKIKLGDTLILISQGYHGVNAAGKFPVKGVVKFASPDLNKKMIYLPLKESQYFFGAPNMVTSLGLKLKSKEKLPAVMDNLKTRLDMEKYEVQDWKEMIPELVEAQKTDAAGNYIFLIVLYLLISFGIFGTILMMTKEREYEFGVLIAVGMKRRLLAAVVWLEVVIMGILGSLIGILLSMPLVYYFKVNPLDFTEYGEEMSGAYEKWGFDPIFPTAFDFSIFFYQALIVFIITSFLATHAIYKIYKLKPVEVMRR